MNGRASNGDTIVTEISFSVSLGERRKPVEVYRRAPRISREY
jgi:hypothetical protein